MKPTGPTNPETRKLIVELRKLSSKQKVKIWKDIAKRLGKPRRRRPVVNIEKLEKLCKKNETLIIPGKLLGEGIITKPLNVSALSCSLLAKEKIENLKGKCLTITELMEKNPKGKGVRIIG